MISFIVIGKNEGWKLKKCFQSIFDTIKYNNLAKYEVIYVDSNSTDNSIEIAKSFKKIEVYQITGICNAAIGRNIGAKESKGDTLFFIDGDMEIMPEFLPLVYSEEKGLIDNFVSGNLVNYYYNYSGKLLIKQDECKIKEKDSIEKVVGGLFLINRKVWENVGGMNHVFKRSQDIDLGLRLSKRNIFLLRKKVVAAKHHTIAYTDKNRMWKDFFSLNHLYGTSLLYRKHIFNKHMYHRFIRNDYTSILLMLIIIITLFSHKLYFMPFYFGIALIRSIINMRSDVFQIPSRFIYLILRDISLWFGLIFFWPKEIENIEYQKIN